jgi:hypothetical protein
VLPEQLERRVVLDFKEIQALKVQQVLLQAQ